jgi:hypothetical protein
VSKLVLTLIVGVFVGAFAVELITRNRSRLFARTRQRARAAAEDFRQAFDEGYSGYPE